jgi:hypothetical protein
MPTKKADDENHKELLDELRALAAKVDPVPQEVTSYAKAALGWRRIDAELAELLSNSERLAATRSGDKSHNFSFRASDLEIDVAIRATETGLVLLGQLAPPSRATIDVERDDGSDSQRVDADDLGRFRVELAGSGRIRLRVRRDSRPNVETSWISVST